MAENPIWIEVTKIATEALVPLSVAIVGWALHGRLKAIEEREANVLEIRKLRVACYSEMSPLLNDLLCYGTYVGHWSTMSPDDALSTKRRLDAVFFRNLFLWTDSQMTAYKGFIDCCFVHSGGPGTVAVSRANLDRHRASWGDRWDPAWSARFVPTKDRVRRVGLQRAYSKLVQEMAAGIGHQIKQESADALLVTARE